MERCDFSSIMAIIRRYISEDKGMSQIDFTYLLFDTFMSSEEAIDFDFDNGQVCRWMTGQAKVSPRIVTYFLDQAHQKELAENICSNIVPLMYDFDMAVQKIYDLVIQDPSISEQKKQELVLLNNENSTNAKVLFLTNVLCFGMERNFLKRDSKTKKLLSTGNLSPALSNYVMGNEVPRPCRHFCGRTEDIARLHVLLSEESKIFLCGIAGIGKSELAKAYAKKYQKEYTNILYIPYGGDLAQDVTDMDFVDDLAQDSERERFRKHNRFLRSLKEDTLLIIDNFNVTAEQDSFLSVMLKYRCRILFTSRSRFDGQSALYLQEISDDKALFQLVSCFYAEAEKHRAVVEKIIETIHRHTLAVELAARLLENGILEPDELLKKMQEEKAALDNADHIRLIKDGQSSKATYYGHIHTLFSLYQLSQPCQNIMRNMVLIPPSGIPARRLAAWLGLSNLNTINDLTETGFITPKPGRIVALHPMIQEIALADLKPSIHKCTVLCRSLQEICLLHGQDISYHKLLFRTIENIIALTDKDVPSYYLRFLEDVFPYMDKYHYEAGMEIVLAEMTVLLNNPTFGTVNDRALLLDFRAAREKRPERSIKLEEEAISLLTEITSDNAQLAANLHANLGGQYRTLRKLEPARQHMEQGIAILEQYGLCCTNDGLAQICNYAVLLTDMGEPDRGLSALHKLSRAIKEYNSATCSDYAIVQEAIGGICLAKGQISRATSHFRNALEIFKNLWNDEPELLKAKYQEIETTYVRAGIDIAQKLLS